MNTSYWSTLNIKYVIVLILTFANSNCKMHFTKLHKITMFY